MLFKMVAKYTLMFLLEVVGLSQKENIQGAWRLPSIVQNYSSECESHSLVSVDYYFWMMDRLLSLNISEQRVRALWRRPRPALPGLVGLHVLGEVVTPHESLAALLAPKPLLPSVCTEVPLKLIWTGEAFATEEPVTDEGPLSSMPAQMCLQVRGLLVHLATLWDVADVESLLSELQPSTVRLAVWAFAPSTSACGAQQTFRGALEESGYLRLVTQHQLPAQGEGMVRRGGVGLW